MKDYVLNEKQLRRLFRRRSYIFDVETGGLDPREHPLIEASLYRVRDQRTHKAVFSWGLPIEGGGWKPLRRHEFLRSLSSWSLEKFRSGVWRSYLKAPKVQSSTWLEQKLAGVLGQGGWIWGHNIRFDLRFVTAHLTPQAYERIVQHLPYQAAWALRRRVLHTTASRLVYQHTALAAKRPAESAELFTQSWDVFRRYLTRVADKPHGMLLDTQYLVQVALAYAQQRGYIPRTHDLFTGTSLAVYRHAWRRTMTGMAHTAGADVALTARLVEDYLDLIGRLRTGQNLTPEQKYALAYHAASYKRVHIFNVRQQFMRARERLLEGKSYELQKVFGEQIYSTDYNDILRLYEARAQATGSDIDYAAIHRQVGKMGLKEIKKALASRDVTLENILSGLHEEAARLLRGESAPISWRQRLYNTAQQTLRWTYNYKFPLTLGVLGAGAVYLALPQRKEQEPLIHNWRDTWLAQRYGTVTQQGGISTVASSYQETPEKRRPRTWKEKAWDISKYIGGVMLGSMVVGATDFIAKRIRIPILSSLSRRGEQYAQAISQWAERRFAAQAQSGNRLAQAWATIKHRAVDAASEVVRYPSAMALGVGSAVVYETARPPSDHSENIERAVGILGVTAVDLLQDLATIAAFRYIRNRWFSHVPSSPILRGISEILHGSAMMTAGFAAATGIIVGTRVIRHYRREKRVEEDPLRHKNLVQNLYKNRNRHHVMNGF